MIRHQRVEMPEEVYEPREEPFDQDYKPDFAPEEVVTGGTYGAGSYSWACSAVMLHNPARLNRPLL